MLTLRHGENRDHHAGGSHLPTTKEQGTCFCTILDAPPPALSEILHRRPGAFPLRNSIYSLGLLSSSFVVSNMLWNYLSLIRKWNPSILPKSGFSSPPMSLSPSQRSSWERGPQSPTPHRTPRPLHPTPLHPRWSTEIAPWSANPTLPSLFCVTKYPQT